jgi:hypothetical protein
MLMPGALAERHQASLARYLATGRKHVGWQAVELVARDKSGREIPVEISFGEGGGKGRSTFTGVIRDVTERKRAEAVRSALFLVAKGAGLPTDRALRGSERRFASSWGRGASGSCSGTPRRAH